MEQVINKVEIEGVNLNSMSEYCVKAYNNEISTFQDVMAVFIGKCGYDRQTALRYTTKIHNDGKCICYWNSKEKCDDVVQAFKRIGVQAETIKNE